MNLEETVTHLLATNEEISEICQVTFFEIVYENVHSRRDSATIYVEVRYYPDENGNLGAYHCRTVGEKTLVNGHPWSLAGDGPTLEKCIANLVMKFSMNLRPTDVISNT
jgi:hypothetical protein